MTYRRPPPLGIPWATWLALAAASFVGWCALICLIYIAAHT